MRHDRQLQGGDYTLQTGVKESKFSEWFWDSEVEVLTSVRIRLCVDKWKVM